MTGKHPQQNPEADDARRTGETFLARLHRRKTEARLQTQTPPAASETQAASLEHVDERDAAPELTDADMPPLESLTPDSDYRGFLSARVSESLRRAALRKLFHSEAFNVIDELDDYAEDFTAFSALGDVVTAEMRHRLEVEARRQAEALARALDESDDAVAAARDPAPTTDADRETTEQAPDLQAEGRLSQGDTSGHV